MTIILGGDSNEPSKIQIKKSPADVARILTCDTLKSTDLGAIGLTLVTWIEEKSLRESNIALSTY